jgi:hypothetical protein
MNPLPLISEDVRTPTRADRLEIARRAHERLQRSGYPALRKVSCLASRDGLYLHGCLPSHYLKQLAQEIALGVEGVHILINRIIVLRPSGRGEPGRTTPAGSKRIVDLPHQSSQEGHPSPNSSETKGVDNHVGPESQAE